MAESARVKGEEPREMCDASQRNVQHLQRRDFMSGWQTHGRKTAPKRIEFSLIADH